MIPIIIVIVIVAVVVVVLLLLLLLLLSWNLDQGREPVAGLGARRPQRVLAEQPDEEPLGCAIHTHAHAQASL